MPRKLVSVESYHESLLESLKDLDEAVQYLNACLENGDARVFLLALRDVAEARGDIRALSRDAHLNRESLYRMHPKSGNPSRSEEHTSELQSLRHLVCRLLLEKK